MMRIRVMSGMLRELRTRSASLTALAAIHAVVFVVCALAITVDTTTVLGIDRWIKPAKFAISIALYLVTIAWLLPATGITGRVRALLVTTIGATMVVEMIAIAMQSARGTTSHYNITSPFDALVFATMGIAIGLNTVAALWLGIGAWRRLRSTNTGYQTGVALGFVLFLAGSAIGGWLVSNRAHTVGAADGGAGLPFVNWSVMHGDIRASHFIALHALQVLPIIGARFGRRTVWGMALVWAAATALLALQASLGRPVV